MYKIFAIPFQLYLMLKIMKLVYNREQIIFAASSIFYYILLSPKLFQETLSLKIHFVFLLYNFKYRKLCLTTESPKFKFKFNISRSRDY